MVSQHSPREASEQLERLVASGDLIAWTEMDESGVAFDCYRLNPERHPDAYRRTASGRRTDG